MISIHTLARAHTHTHTKHCCSANIAVERWCTIANTKYLDENLSMGSLRKASMSSLCGQCDLSQSVTPLLLSANWIKSVLRLYLYSGSVRSCMWNPPSVGQASPMKDPQACAKSFQDVPSPCTKFVSNMRFRGALSFLLACSHSWATVFHFLQKWTFMQCRIWTLRYNSHTCAMGKKTHPLGGPLAQCVHSATIWACGPHEKPIFCYTRGRTVRCARAVRTLCENAPPRS